MSEINLVDELKKINRGLKFLKSLDDIRLNDIKFDSLYDNINNKFMNIMIREYGVVSPKSKLNMDDYSGINKNVSKKVLDMKDQNVKRILELEDKIVDMNKDIEMSSLIMDNLNGEIKKMNYKLKRT